MAYDVGILFCPSCFAKQSFSSYELPRPGQHASCFCDECDYEFPASAVPDEVRAKAMQEARDRQYRYIADRVGLPPGKRFPWEGDR